MPKIEMWEASEIRQFLLKLCSVLLPNVLHEVIYYSLLHFSVLTCLLSSENWYENYLLHLTEGAFAVVL